MKKLALVISAAFMYMAAPVFAANTVPLHDLKIMQEKGVIDSQAKNYYGHHGHHHHHHHHHYYGHHHHHHHHGYYGYYIKK